MKRHFKMRSISGQLFFGAIYHLIDDNRPFLIIFFFLSIVKSKLIVSLAFFANRF